MTYVVLVELFCRAFSGHGTASMEAKTIMDAATEADYRAILDGAGDLYECRDFESLQRVACVQINRLVRSDCVTFSHLAPTLPEAAVAGWPGLRAENEAREKIFARHLAEHPALRHYLATGDPSAYKISDFLSADQYHALGLYQQLYGELRCEDQFVFMLFPLGSEWICVAVARNRRDFTERDREILNLFRPTLARAYRFLDRLDRLRGGIREAGTRSFHTRVTAVVLDAEDHPVRFWSESKSWLSRFFHRQRPTLSGIPDSVSAWLRRGRRVETLNHPNGWGTLTRERGGQCLRVQVVRGLRNTERILVLGLQTPPGALEGGGTDILTRREVEILQEVEQGKSNDEVSVALGISSLTVRKHLENIFHKLHVPNRTAAVIRFRQTCAELATGFYGVLSLLDDAMDLIEAFLV